MADASHNIQKAESEEVSWRDGWFSRIFSWVVQLNELQVKSGRRTAWVSKELLIKLEHKKEACRMCKQGHVALEEYKDIVWSWRDGVREAKAHLDLNLLKDVKTNKIGFYGYSSSKRKTRENENQLLKEEGNQLEHDMEKAEIINVFFTSAFHK